MIGDIWEVTLRGRIDGHETINVLHYRTFFESGGNPLTPAQVAVAASALWSPLLKGATSTAWTYEKATAQKIRPLPLTVGFETTADAGPGTIAGDYLPATVAVVMTKLTALAGRANRGRMYGAGVAELHTTGPILNAAGSTAWTPVKDALPAPLISGGGNGSVEPIIYHRATGTGELVTTDRLNLILGNQRKRRQGVGA